MRPLRVADVVQPFQLFAKQPKAITKGAIQKSVLVPIVAYRNRRRPKLYPRTELWHVLSGLFCRGWWYVGPGILGISETRFRQLCREKPGEWNSVPTLAQLSRLDRWAARMPGMLEEWRLESIATINAEAERRSLEIAGAVTRLRQMIIVRRAADESKKREAANRRLQRKAREKEGRV